MAAGLVKAHEDMVKLMERGQDLEKERLTLETEKLKANQTEKQKLLEALTAQHDKDNEIRDREMQMERDRNLAETAEKIDLVRQLEQERQQREVEHLRLVAELKEIKEKQKFEALEKQNAKMRKELQKQSQAKEVIASTSLGVQVMPPGGSQQTLNLPEVGNFFDEQFHMPESLPSHYRQQTTVIQTPSAMPPIVTTTNQLPMPTNVATSLIELLHETDDTFAGQMTLQTHVAASQPTVSLIVGSDTATEYQTKGVPQVPLTSTVATNLSAFHVPESSSTLTQLLAALSSIRTQSFGTPNKSETMSQFSSFASTVSAYTQPLMATSTNGSIQQSSLVIVPGTETKTTSSATTQLTKVVSSLKNTGSQMLPNFSSLPSTASTYTSTVVSSGINQKPGGTPPNSTIPPTFGSDSSDPTQASGMSVFTPNPNTMVVVMKDRLHHKADKYDGKA